jgi:2-C-methyl-D-erythritol 4-phosphate cytidylyltransferase
MQSDNPKQYLLIDEKPVLVHTLLKLQRSSLIDDILLVVPENDIFSVRENIERQYRLTKIRNVIAGGKERQDSVSNGLAYAGNEYDIVVIHDGVRPFVTEDMLARSIEAALRFGAAVAGIPSKDTVKEVDCNGGILRTLDRETIWLAQTPQVFRRQVIQDAYARAAADDYRGTDDASLVERLGITVRMVMGSYTNIKITTPEDLVWAEAFVKDAAVHDLPPAGYKENDDS